MRACSAYGAGWLASEKAANAATNASSACRLWHFELAGNNSRACSCALVGARLDPTRTCYQQCFELLYGFLCSAVCWTGTQGCCTEALTACGYAACLGRSSEQKQCVRLCCSGVCAKVYLGHSALREG